MPKFIKEAPWYLAKDGEPNKPEEAVLFHQRIETDKNKKQSIDNWYQKGYRKQAKAITKFRKGACENCGAISHKTKECIERPRKIGAKWTQRDIAQDEYDTTKQKINLTYESKRDRWNGYNPDIYKEQVIDEWELKDQLAKEQKAKIKQEAKLKKQKEKRDQGVDDVYSSDSDDEKSVESKEEGGGGGAQNLRIREDTAKYLRNLDPNSAPYDPKSRSMKTNPNPNIAEQDQDFKGDNFVKLSGDYLNLIKNEGFMLDINKKAEAAGSNLITNTMGMPSQFEMLQKEFKNKKSLIQSDKMNKIQGQYGNQEEHMKMPNEIQEQLKDQYEQQQMELLEEQMDRQRQATQIEKDYEQKVHKQGEAVVSVRKRADGLTGAVKSKYEQMDGETNYGGHEMVWGSYWNKESGWGYKCCHSHDRNSKCLGVQGKFKKPVVKDEVKQILPSKRQRSSSSSSSNSQQKRQKRHDSESD